MTHIKMSYQMYPKETEKMMRGVAWWPSFKEGHRLRWAWHDDQYDDQHDDCDDQPYIFFIEYDDCKPEVRLRTRTNQ